MADLEMECAEVDGVTAIIPLRLLLELDRTACRLLVIALVTCKSMLKKISLIYTIPSHKKLH
jgi:hypothetical protein